MRLYATVIVAALALAACHRGEAPAPAAAPIKRVVSLAASSTEILFAVGAGDLIVGVDSFSNYPTAAKAIARVGSEMAPSRERIIALQPDVVFVSTSANGREVGAELEGLHIRVFASEVTTIAGMLDDIRRIGAAVGHEAQAEALVTRLRARLDAVRAGVAGKPRPRTLAVVWPDPLTVAGGKSFVHEAVDIAGGDDVAADAEVPYPHYSNELLLARAPEVIVIGAHGNTPSPASFARFPSLPAVHDHRVQLIDSDLLFRPGPRLVDGIELLAHLLHP